MMKIYREIIGIAKAEGVTDARIVHRGRHAQLAGCIGGEAFSMTVPGTPSERRGLDNLRADLKRRTRHERRTGL